MLPRRPSIYEQIPNGGTFIAPKPEAKAEEIAPVRERARHEDGTFKEDDPSTPEDEAWVESPAD